MGDTRLDHMGMDFVEECIHCPVLPFPTGEDIYVSGRALVGRSIDRLCLAGIGGGMARFEAKVSCSATKNSQTLQERTKLIDDSLRQLSGPLKTIPALVVYLCSIAHLVEEAKECEEAFQQISELYPGTSVADKPFSNWRPFVSSSTPLTEDVRDGVRWARYLERHQSHVSSWCSRWTVAGIDIWPEGLAGYVSTWRTAHRGDVSGDMCLHLLKKHREVLEKIQDDVHAAQGAAAGSVKAAISVMDDA